MRLPIAGPLEATVSGGADHWFVLLLDGFGNEIAESAWSTEQEARARVAELRKALEY